jgi:hypothetical protein
MNLCKFNYIWKQFSTINYVERANMFLSALTKLLDLIHSICSDMKRERERDGIASILLPLQAKKLDCRSIHFSFEK